MKRLHFVLIEGFADWEYGLLAALARESFAADVAHASPGGRAVTSIGGLVAKPGLRLEEVGVEDFDALVVVGSEGWQKPEVRALVAPLAAAAHRAGRVVAGICGGTLALAEAGLLEGRAHTSNRLDFLTAHVGSYRGADHYVDRPRAVAADRVVSAPGTAPATFAREVARLLWPERAAEIAGFAAMMAAEHEGASAAT
ncbi:MAG: DJ-1/PfpI family protein [Siculibacillus sp.]|nr:DJ-1/PfpI family protein [Siculibacillus sp.]